MTNQGGPTCPQRTTSPGKFYIWNKPFNLHKITRKTWIAAALHNHALFVFFIKSSPEPERSTWANHASWEPYYGWHWFGRAWVEFFTDVWRTLSTAHRSRDCSTLSHTTEVKEHHNWILKPKQVSKEVKAVRLATGAHCRVLGPVSGCFVCGTGSLCKTNRPGAGNTRPDPGTAASCHTFHTPTIKIPERIRPQHYIQSNTLSCSFPPSALSTALTHSVTTAGAPPPTHWYRRRQLRPQRPHSLDGEEWYILSKCNYTWTGIRCQDLPRKRSVH